MNAYFAATTQDEVRKVLENHQRALLSEIAIQIIYKRISDLRAGPQADVARIRSLERVLQGREVLRELSYTA